jgi:membrane protein DedA with SNARE-associated domain
MTGFLATLAIAVAGTVLGLIIAHFSGRRKATEKTRDIEELKRKLFDKIEQDVREVRETYAEHN